MKTFIEKRLRIYEDELGRLVWVSSIFLALFFVMAIFRNYVDTAFLKRYDVDKIPLMLVINGFLTYFVLEVMRRFERKFSDPGLLAAFLAGYSLMVGCLLLAVKAGMSLAYPVLFQLLHVKDSVLLVYLWNIAGDLFDARQGKRLFPLVTVSQVLGTTLGNFSTDPIIHGFGIDSILVLSCLLSSSIALVLSLTGGIAAKRAATQARRVKAQSKKLTEIPALMKRYPIVRYLIVVGMIPNILLPIFTYQFSVVADSSFASEQSLATFLSYFRGSMTLVVFCMLLFMGRFYSRIGLANASLVQPVNFMAVFGALSLSFNIYAAAFGQCSIRLVQQAIAGPAGKILFNFVPGEVTAWSRVFVRGTVVKVGVVLGSLLTLALKPMVTQKQLSMMAFCIALYWLIEVLVFCKRYKASLKQVILEKRIDFDKMEENWAAAGMAHPIVAPMRNTDTGYEDEAEPSRDERLPRIDPEIALEMLDDADDLTRAKAAASFAVSRDPRAVTHLVEFLGDRDVVRRAAVESLIHYGESIHPLLESVLMESTRRVQQIILEVLRLSGQKNPDLLPFFAHQLMAAYNNLVAIKVLSVACESRAIEMLKMHLEEENRQIMGIIFHALWVNHADMRLMYEALHSSESSIAVEMLEATVDRSLTRYIVPLIDNIPLDMRIQLGRKLLPLMQIETVERILLHMTKRSDPTTKMLAVYAIGEHLKAPVFLPAVQPLLKDRDLQVRQVADYAIKRCMNKEPDMPEAIQRINTLRDFILFDGMGIRELQAIATIATWGQYQSGDIIVREGEVNPCLYLVIEGRIDTYRDHASPGERHLDSMGPWSFFGEVRLFTELPSEMTYIAAEPTEALILSKNQFHEIMKIYPQIGLNLCLFFALRLTFQLESSQEYQDKTE